jgi:hypothetical protein
MNTRESRPAIVKTPLRSVIHVTSSHSDLCFNLFVRWAAKQGKNGGWHGEATMSRNLTNSVLYDVNVIDDRNQRPLTIALATIVTMWLLTFGLVFVSTHLRAESVQMARSAAPIAGSINK